MRCVGDHWRPPPPSTPVNISTDLGDSQKWSIFQSDKWQFTDRQQNDMPVTWEFVAWIANDNGMILRQKE